MEIIEDDTNSNNKESFDKLLTDLLEKKEIDQFFLD